MFEGLRLKGSVRVLGAVGISQSEFQLCRLSL